LSKPYEGFRGLLVMDELVERLEKLALSSDLNPEGRACVIRMLGTIGTSRALMALLNIAEQSGIEDRNRVLALQLAEKIIGALRTQAPQAVVTVEERVARVRPSQD
jgi:hypothetical protein